MLRKLEFSKIENDIISLLFLLLIITIPFNPLLNSYVLISLLLLLIVKKLRAGTIAFPDSKHIYLFPLFFLTVIIFNLFEITKVIDIVSFKSNVEEYLSFIAIPIVIFLLQKTHRFQLVKFKMYFVYIISVISIFLIARGIVLLCNGAEVELITYKNFLSPLGLHPTYFALYCQISLVFLSEKKYNRVNWIMFLICFLGILLSASKIGVAVLISFIIYFLLFKLQTSTKKSLVFIAILVLVLSVFLKFNSYFNNRMSRILITLQAESPDRIYDPIGHRLKLYKVYSSVFQDHLLFGVGLGQMPIYQEKYCLNFYNAARCRQIKGFGPHNQFLSIAIESGLFVFIFFFTIILTRLIFVKNRGIKNYKVIYIIFILYFLTESVLEVQKGIVFFMIFDSLFTLKKLTLMKS
jgi:hypothetical protein